MRRRLVCLCLSSCTTDFIQALWSIFPRRELAQQIADQFRAIGSHIAVRDCLVIGGTGLCPLKPRHELPIVSRPVVPND